VSQGPLSGPTLAGKVVYVQSVDALNAFDAITGKGVWIATNPGGLKTMGESLRGRAPQVAGDLVVGWTDDLVFATPRTGGDFAWVVAAHATSNTVVAGSDVVFATAKGLFALSPQPWGPPR
jgi:hypothetical protein